MTLADLPVWVENWPTGPQPEVPWPMVWGFWLVIAVWVGAIGGVIIAGARRSRPLTQAALIGGLFPGLGWLWLLLDTFGSQDTERSIRPLPIAPIEKSVEDGRR